MAPALVQFVQFSCGSGSVSWFHGDQSTNCHLLAATCTTCSSFPSTLPTIIRNYFCERSIGIIWRFLRLMLCFCFLRSLPLIDPQSRAPTRDKLWHQVRWTGNCSFFRCSRHLHQQRGEIESTIIRMLWSVSAIFKWPQFVHRIRHQWELRSNPNFLLDPNPWTYHRSNIVNHRILSLDNKRSTGKEE